MVKYGPCGGFTPERVGKKLPGGVVEALCKAANSSLAASTWRKYETCLRAAKKMMEKRGVKISFPLSQEELWMVVGALIQDGKKPATVDGYLCSLKQAHKVRGYSADIFEDPLVKSATKGMKNVVASEPKVEKVVVSIQMMKVWRKRVKALALPYVDRRMIWLSLSWIFCGSLRPSELLAEGERMGSEVGLKALRWKNILEVEERSKGLKEEVVQISLTAPKTVRSMPRQVVALPAVQSVLCPVSAWKAFAKAGKGRMDPEGLVFCWSGGRPFTSRELGRLLALWSGPEARVTPRDLRAALPSLLARKGVKEETLKMLGRWSSSAFNNYIRKGRANSWAEARKALEMVLM